MFVLLTSDETISKSFDFVSFASLICKIWIINYSVESQYRLGMIQNRTAGENGRIKLFSFLQRKEEGTKIEEGSCFICLRILQEEVLMKLLQHWKKK